MSYADRDRYGMYRNMGSAGPGPALMGAHTLIGDGVVNAAEEDLGDIKEIMLDMHTGRVAYVVLAFGGFFGMGEKLFAVPWQALHLDTVNKRMVLNVEREKLKRAPGFNREDWPDMDDIAWANSIHSFYGTDLNRLGAPSIGPAVPVRSMPGSIPAGSAMGGASGSSMGAGYAGAAPGAEAGQDGDGLAPGHSPGRRDE